jgi:hypothetical protein
MAATRLAEEKLAQRRESQETKGMERAEAATRKHLKSVENKLEKDAKKLESDAEKLEKAKAKAAKKASAEHRKFLLAQKRLLEAENKKRRLEADIRGAPDITKKRRARDLRPALLPPGRRGLRSSRAPELPLPALSPPRSLQSTRPMPTSAASPRCPLQNPEPFLSALSTRLPLQIPEPFISALSPCRSLQSPISMLTSPRPTGNPKRLASPFSPRLLASGSEPKSKVRKQLF